MSDPGGICTYVLDSDDPETWGGKKGDKCHVDTDVLNEDGVWICPHDTKDGNELCIFHQPVPEKDDEEVVEAFLKVVQTTPSDVTEPDRNYQFLGAEFGTFELSDDPVVSEDDRLNFSYADFGNVDVAGIDFGDGAIFHSATFRGTATFRGVEFGDSVDFGRVEFKETAKFDRAEFGETSNFCRAVFHASAGFSETLFKGNTTFELATFKDRATFTYAIFESGSHLVQQIDQVDTQFRNAEFRGYTSFEWARFRGKTNFSKVILRSSAFCEAAFQDDVEFWDAELSDGSDFSGATFGGEVSFSMVEFGRRGAFSRTQFAETAKFKESVFDSFTFDGADLTDAVFTNAKLRNADFEGALLSRATLLGADLRGAKLSGAVLSDARIDAKTTFLGHPADDNSARRSKPRCVYDPHYEDDKEHADVDKAKGVYRALEELAGKAARPQLQSQCFVRRQDLQKDDYKRTAKEANSLQKRIIAGARYSRAKVARATLLYGESPWRIIGGSIGLIVAFTVLYPLGGWVRPVDGEPITWSAIAQDPALFGDVLYYSTLTFTTLGLGDYRPIGVGKYLTTVNTALGAVLIALLVFVLGRRAAR